METTFIDYPLQRVPYSQKTPEWRKANVDFFINKSMIGSYGGATRMEKLDRNYKLYNGDIRREDFEYVTNPYGVEEKDNFPANLKNINILKTEIDLLIGEETKRPFNPVVFQTNPNVLNSKIKEKDESLKQMLEVMIVEKLMLKYGPELQNSSPEQQQKMMQEKDAEMKAMIENHIEHSQKDELEEGANHYVRWAMQKFELKDLFLNTWKDGLIAGVEIGYVGDVNGRIYPERVNPRSFDFDKNPDLYYIHESNWCVRRMMMDPTSVIDKFGDILEPEDKDSIMRNHPYGNANTNSPSDVQYNFMRYSNDNVDPEKSFLSNQMPVYHVCWRSYTEVGYVVGVNELTGEQTEDVVSRGYVAKEGEKITWDWIVQIWQGWKIGDFYAGVEATDYIDMPYVGVIYNNDNTASKSMVDIMFPIIVTYIIVWYRLELAMARDKGKIITMDITQIPKSQGIDLERWMTYLGAHGVNLVNPYEDGWDIQRGGHPSNFNQFSSQDLSMGEVIAQYINLLGKVEELMGYISGITKQRMGAISTYELVGNVERGVTQSSHITEPLFYKHNQFKRVFLKKLVERGQQCWENQDNTLSYIMDDLTKMVWTMPNEFPFSDLDIFIGDPSDEIRKLESVRQLSQPAIQAGASLYEAAQMFVSDSKMEIMHKLKEIDSRKAQIQAEQSKAQSESSERMIKMQEDGKMEDRRIQEEDSIRKAETLIRVAEINKEAKLEVAMETADEFLKELQQDKLEIDNKKADAKINADQQNIDEKKRSNQAKENIMRNKPTGGK